MDEYLRRLPRLTVILFSYEAVSIMASMAVVLVVVVGMLHGGHLHRSNSSGMKTLLRLGVGYDRETNRR